MKRSGFKRKHPYVDPVERKIRDSAEGEECTIRLEGVCNGRTDTTVYCHSNLLEHGKGMGLKAKSGAYGCFNCHNVLDYRAPRPKSMSYDEMLAAFNRGVEETRLKLIKKGIIKNGNDEAAQEPGSDSPGEGRSSRLAQSDYEGDQHYPGEDSE